MTSMWYMCLVGMAVIMQDTASAMERSCPVYSRFDYDEKLLERVIRNELALKDMLDRITETNSKVQETLKQIEKENAKLNHALHALEEKDRALQDKVGYFLDDGAQNASVTVAEIKTAVQALVEQTAKELVVMKEKSAVPQVRFYARHPDGQRLYSSNKDIEYSIVLINDGGGYSPTTGHFTASAAGVYMFTVQYCPTVNKWAFLEIVHAGRALQRSGHKGEEGGNAVCVSMQAFAKVAMGDKVWVRATSTTDIYHDDSYRWGSFAGLFISL